MSIRKKIVFMHDGKWKESTQFFALLPRLIEYFIQCKNSIVVKSACPSKAD